MHFALLLLILASSFIQGHHTSASLRPENTNDEVMEPDFQPIRKRVRSTTFQKERIHKRQKLLGELGQQSEEIRRAIDSGDIKALKVALLGLKGGSVHELPKLAQYACDSEKWEPLQRLLDCEKLDITEIGPQIFLRALQMRQLAVLFSLITMDSIKKQHLLMKHAAITLFRLYIRPGTTTLKRKRPLMAIILKQINDVYSILGDPSGLRYLADTVAKREVVENAFAEIGLIEDEEEIITPDLVHIDSYLDLTFNDDTLKLVWLMGYYGHARFFNEVVLYLPRALLLPLEWEISTLTCNPVVLEFMELVGMEEDKITAPVHEEERFWANCLFDSYSHLFGEAEAAYEGSVAVESDIVVSYFPKFTQLFLEHFRQIGPQLVRDAEELTRLHRLMKLIGNIAESGNRYDDPSGRDQLFVRLSALETGEEYGLDIYALEGEADRTGHLVAAIVTRRGSSPQGEPLFDMRVINTGCQSFEACGFKTRIVLFVDQLCVPLSVLMERYGQAIRQDSLSAIYLPEHIPELHMGIYDRNSPEMVAYLETDFPTCSPPTYAFEHTSRGQRWGTCSVRRLWAMAKLVLGPDLYMEFKVHFVLGFVGRLSMNLKSVVEEEWDSPRASVWHVISKTRLLEGNLLRQLERLDPKTERYTRLKETIQSSVRAQSESP